MTPRLTAIIQARMSSTRLPGKMLRLLDGRPMIERVVRRVERSSSISQVVVATSVSPADDPLASFCEEQGIACFRGDEADVLDRFYQAARHFDAQVVVRVPGDCPLADPAVIDKVAAAYFEQNAEYSTNTFRYTYPDGLDVEIFSFATLENAWRNAKAPAEREHVTPYIRHDGRFRSAAVENEVDLSSRKLRWAVDDERDFVFVETVWRKMVSLGRPDFNCREVLEMLDAHPEIAGLQSDAAINEGYYKSLFDQATAGAAAARPIAQSLAWLERAQKVVPGAAQTFSKGYTQHVVGASPLFLDRGKGCRVWDVDGNEYVDYIQGLLPNILGYAHPDVNRVYAERLNDGHSFSLPHPLEVQLAEKMREIIPCAEMTRFAKNGSDATTAAVRLARAYTNRERIACSGYHGWHDWFIGTTTRHLGVPGGVRELTSAFPYNDIAALEALLDAHPGEFAAVIMEPFNFFDPAPGYLERVREVAHRHGALLVFDEICTGFHFGLGGMQRKFGVTPDLACFGKAMGNGFPIACLTGKAEVMKTCEEIFFSTTFGGEVAAMAAALKVIEILETTDVLARMQAHGGRLQDGIRTMARIAGLQERVSVLGNPAWSLVKFKDEAGKDSLLMRSLFQQEMSRRGVLMLTTLNMSAAHDHQAVEQTLEALASVLKTLAQWIDSGDLVSRLEGRPIEPVFKVRG